MVMTAAGDMVVSLMGAPSAAGVARTLVEARIRAWDNLDILGDSLLIASELVTNAAQRTPYKEIRLQISRDSLGIVLGVWDADPEFPRLKPKVRLTLKDLDVSEEAFDRNGGWGLHIVQALAITCGAVRDPSGGKWIWARLLT